MSVSAYIINGRMMM